MTYIIGRALMQIKMEGFHEWEQEIASIASKGFTFCVNVSIMNPQLVFLTYPVEWSDYYRKHFFTIRDPVLHWASYSEGYTRWSDVPGHDGPAYTRRVMEVARTYGLNYGGVFVTRNKEPQRRKCFLTAAREDRQFTDTEMERLWELFLQGLDTLKGSSGMSPSEITVLQLLATGKTQDEIADEISISRDAVKKRVERARVALKARNTLHAVTIAIARGVVDVWDVEGTLGEENDL